MIAHSTRTWLRRGLLGAGMLAWLGSMAAQETAKPAPPTSAEAPKSQFPKQTFTYKTVGECNIQADVYRPPGTGPRPGILWVHGGALISGSRENLRTVQMERYVSAGFVVVSIDYRLAPETKLPAIIDDLREAYAWMRAKGPALFGLDADRIGVIGHSAGGYLTQMSGFVLTPRPKALVSFYGYGDIVGEWYSRPAPFYSKSPAVPRDEAYAAVGGAIVTEGSGRSRGRFYLYCRQQGLWPKEVSGFDPDKEPRAFDRFCPIRNVTRDYPPTMLLHGDTDTDVPFQLSVDMDKELTRHGVRHEFIQMKNRGHGFDGGREALRDPEITGVFDRVIAFLKEHLGS